MPETTPEQQRQAAEAARAESAPDNQKKDVPQTAPSPTAGSPAKLQPAQPTK